MFDYSIHETYMKKILKDMFTNNISNFLAFKGGTLVYLLYNLDRFSTDIDLDVLNKNEEEKIIETIRNILPIYGEIKNETLGKTLHRRVFRYDEKSMNIKIEINKRIRKNNTYEYKTIDGIKLKCMKKDSIFANKLVALSERFYPRDLYDVYFFFDKKFPINKDLIIERTGLSLNFFLQKLQKELSNYFTENNILVGLGEVLDEKQKKRVKSNLLNKVVAQINNYIDNK